MDAAGVELPPELAFLLGRDIAVERLVEAARLSRRCGVPGDAALLASRLMSSDAYYQALADAVGLRFQAGGFSVHPRARPTEAVRSGMAPLETDSSGPARFLYAPRGAAVAALLRGAPLCSQHYLLTTPEGLRRAVFAAAGPAIAREAAEALARERPQDSFHGGVSRGQVAASFGLAAAAGVAALAFEGAAASALTLGLGLPFLALAAIKIAAALQPSPLRMPTRIRRDRDDELPVYTVLIPLYRETRVIPQLLAAMRDLDYPAAKLEVMILVEECDRDTPAALAAQDLPGFVQVVTAPAGAPRTKPRALNVALPLARGRYLTIYDAEDRPDPGQLRAAVQVFDRSEPDVACLQARLVIDNTEDGVLTRFFTVEYGALFDVVNPALARFDLPIPLGGTSNHFRVDVLRALGGWDPWNVTEDADLAVRLAVAGYRVADLPSSTLEEAPARFRAWMAQRTRWMKGFVQVAITHGRRPLHNLRRLGPGRFCGAGALIFGAVASAAVYPIFLVLVTASLIDGSLLASREAGDIANTAIALTLIVAGALAMTLPGLAALARRGWWRLWPYALAMPAYYLLVSLAAWRGLYELIVDPDRWNKTEHGLARTSRGASPSTAARAGPAPPSPAAAPS